MASRTRQKVSKRSGGHIFGFALASPSFVVDEAMPWALVGQCGKNGIKEAALPWLDTSAVRFSGL
jgi:hypothetical protein